MMPRAFESVVHIDAEMLCGLEKDNGREASTSPGSTGGTDQVPKAGIAPGTRDVRIDKDGEFCEGEDSLRGTYYTEYKT